MKAKTHLSQAKSHGGFTLVEMLVVIGMIAALAGISFPVYKSIQKKVEKQQIFMTMNSIEQAVDNFETEYNYLPYVGAAYPTGDHAYWWGASTGGLMSEFLGILMGLESTKNFKRIEFLELPEAKGSGPGNDTSLGPHGFTNGVVVNGNKATLYNHVGMPYVARLDLNNDGKIANPRIPGGWPTTSPMVTGHRVLLNTSSESAWSLPDYWTNFD